MHAELEGAGVGIVDVTLEAVDAGLEGRAARVRTIGPFAPDDRFEVAKRLRLFERFMISMRNDETVTMGPGEPEHGKGSYHYDGYLFWRDEKTDPLPWFSHHTGRSEDLYWSVNRAKIHLQQCGSEDRLNVLLDVEMPNFERFESRHDCAEWRTCADSFDWPLAEGDNRLEIRPVNAFERPGTSSWVVVTR